MGSPFIHTAEAYKRDLDVLTNYIETSAKHLTLQTGVSMEAAREFVTKLINEKYKPKSPELGVLRRPIRGDRKKAKGDFLGYLKWVSDNKHIMAPNMIAYANPHVEKSIMADFIEMNLKLRSKIKKEGALAKMRGDLERAEFCELGQANAKIRNNSVSGATSSAHNALYYGSAHTTLTSTCRAVTSYANATNEKLLASNRHYYAPENVLADIAYISRAAPIEYIQVAMDKHGIVPPTVDYTMDLILRSSREYWASDEYEALIRRSVEGMTVYERSAFVYCNDLLSLSECNDRQMRNFMNALIKEPEPYMGDDVKDIVKAADADLLAMVGLFCSNFMRGISATDMYDKDERLYRIYAARIIRAQDIFEEHKFLIMAFWSTMLMPPSIHSVPTIMRKAVAASDTDSSIFSARRIVRWFCGGDEFSHRSMCVAAIAGYITSQIVAHTIALLCKQIGVVDEDLFKLTMKSEFYFPTVTVTTRTKHYMATIAAKEGNVYEHDETEIKGVALKSSKLPTDIKGAAGIYQRRLLDAICDDANRLTPMQVIGVPAKIEHYIRRMVETGDASLYRHAQIKAKEGYKNPMAADYIYSEMWNAVFAQKYGMLEQLPADMIKVPVNLKNAAAIKAWADQMEPTLGQSLLNWVALVGKGNFTQILVPSQLLINGKLPLEVRMVIDIEKLLRSLMEPFYITAEAYGIVISNSKNTRFFSDCMTEEEANRHLLFNPLDTLNAE